jgi:hypothetical protein
MALRVGVGFEDAFKVRRSCQRHHRRGSVVMPLGRGDYRLLKIGALEGSDAPILGG